MIHVVEFWIWWGHRSFSCLLFSLKNISCCPSPTPCPSHPTTGNTQTSTSWGFECEETWNGRRRDHKSSSTFTLLPSESRAGSMFNLYPISMVTGAFIMFAAMLACFLWCMLTCLLPKSTAELFKCFREFNCLLSIRRKIVVAKQNYRCAGCGTRIDPGTINKGFKIYPLFEYSSWVKQTNCRCCFAWTNITFAVIRRILFLVQITSSGCVTVNTWAVTSASAATRTRRRSSLAECWGSGTSASTTSATSPAICWARLRETRCSTWATSTVGCTRRSKVWRPSGWAQGTLAAQSIWKERHFFVWITLYNGLKWSCLGFEDTAVSHEESL